MHWLVLYSMSDPILNMVYAVFYFILTIVLQDRHFFLLYYLEKKMKTNGI